MLVTTLTKKMAEDLTDYLLESGVKARYLHSEIDTLERIQIVRDLRLGEYDVLVGVNLLREGLDLPEVSLVAILDADKEGFLRGRTSLIQTIGRAARNVNGKVLMYADKQTEAIKEALDETNRRRAVQLAYNEEHGIEPETIVKGVSDIAELLQLESPTVPSSRRRRGATKVEGMSREELEKLVVTLEEEMYVAAEELRFEYAAKLRDEIKELRRELQALERPPRKVAFSRGLRATLRACSEPSVASLVLAFVTGALARFALPGPDPMPAWLTIAIGLVGSARRRPRSCSRSAGARQTSWAGIASFFVAVGLVVVYRRFVQKRPVWGKDAYRFPERGFGVEQYRERLKRAGIDPDQIGDAAVRRRSSRGRRCSRFGHRAPDDHSGDDPTDNPAHYLGLLEELHDSGVLDDDEYDGARLRLLESLRS